MALAALGVLVVAAVVGIIFSALIYALILGLPMAFLAATIVLSRRAERAAYKQIEGQPGAVGAALRSIRRGWYIEETPVAADAQRATDLQSAALRLPRRRPARHRPHRRGPARSRPEAARRGAPQGRAGGLRGPRHPAARR